MGIMDKNRVIKTTRSKCLWQVQVGQKYCPDRTLQPDDAYLKMRRLGQDCGDVMYSPRSIDCDVLLFQFGDLIYDQPGRYGATLYVRDGCGDWCKCETFEFQVGDHCVTKDNEILDEWLDAEQCGGKSDLSCNENRCGKCYPSHCSCSNECPPYGRVHGPPKFGPPDTLEEIQHATYPR